MGAGCSTKSVPPVEPTTMVQRHTPVDSLHRGHESTSSLVNVIELGEEVKQKPTKASYTDFLSSSEFKVFTLRESNQLNHNTRQLRFWLSNGCIMDIPVGSHIMIRALIGGQHVTRNYTPTTTANDKGYFDILVKSYEEGKVSKHLYNLKLGEAVDIKGPFGRYSYSPNAYHTICMLCGGTGLSPMLQVIKTVLLDSKDTTKLHLLFANHSEDDIINKTELETWNEAHTGRFFAHHIISVPKPGWDAAKTGRIDLEKIRKLLPAPTEGTQVLICGPYLFNKSMQTQLTEAGFTKEMIFIF